MRLRTPTLALAALALTATSCGATSTATPVETVTVTAPAPSAAPVVEPEPSESATVVETEEGPYEDLQPIDGGTYTWSSTGITIDLAVEVTEIRGGEPDDLCGDGSCGVLEPEDTTVTIRYDVTVPDDYAGGPFDASYCELSAGVVNGNDDEAITGLAGGYYSPIDGAILPGASKFGIDEFVVDAEHAGDEFLLTTACGDPDSYEEAYFVGPLG